MLKKIYRKNGFIFINEINEIQLNYYIIHHIHKETNLNILQKKYYQTIGYQYE